MIRALEDLRGIKSCGHRDGNGDVIRVADGHAREDDMTTTSYGTGECAMTERTVTRDDVIRVSEPMALGAEAEDDIAEVLAQTGPLESQRDIRPATARAIAARWQSSGATGSVLGLFASGYLVLRWELVEDIHNTCVKEGLWLLGSRELDLLAMFVINQGVIR